MDKIKILQFPIANSYGGITHYALGNWEWMDKQRFHCDFATLSKTLDFEEKILSYGSKIHYISCYAEEDRKQFLKEFDRILDEGYDIVHLHTRQWKSLLAEEACRKHGVPKVIIHAHNTGIGMLDPEKRKMETQQHEEVKKQLDENSGDEFWACSEKAADFLFGGQIAKEKIKIMPNAIDLNKFAFDQEIRNQYRKTFGLDGHFVIGHAGRFEYQKNHEFLIDMFYEISKKIDRARLVLLGNGQLFSSIQDKVSNLGIENKVLFLGKREDINNWYQAMDVFCMPSRFEGLPISMVEAQASGLPCIASDSITKEVKICEHVSLVPFVKEIWINEIIDMTKMEHERTDSRKYLIQHGYDIRTQIKRIEKEYMSIQGL